MRTGIKAAAVLGIGAVATVAGVGSASASTPGAMNVDSNSDGVYDTLLVDTNGDGYYDIEAYDADQNGMIEKIILDPGYDRYFELVTFDWDQDGRLDVLEGDSDLDGVIDWSMPVVSVPNYGATNWVISSPTSPGPMLVLMDTFTQYTGLAVWNTDIDSDGSLNSDDADPHNPQVS